MAEANAGISTVAPQMLLYRKRIEDVLYVRCDPIIVPPFYVGYIELGVAFGESGDTRLYSVVGKKLYGNAIAIYPSFESRVANGNYYVRAFWRVAGVPWTLNSF